MGFTALDGLPMGTRCGAIDPGVMLYLMDERRMDARAIEKLLYNQSGLLGVSGISSDMRTLLASSEPRAKLAIDLFVLSHSGASSARSPPRSAGWTRSCSPAALARTRPPSANGCAAMRPGSASSWTRPRTPRVAPHQHARRPGLGVGRFRPTRN